MSHQTGIKPNEELEKFCAKCKQDGSSRIIKCTIKNEQICLEDHREPQGKWEEDYYRYVNKLVDDNQPCYLLFRFDTRNSFGVHEWVISIRFTNLLSLLIAFEIISSKNLASYCLES